MKKYGLLSKFLVRWLVCSLGLWIATGLFSSHISLNPAHTYIVAVTIAGFILAVVNAFIRPILILFSLPAILLTLGLFMIVINGLTVWLASYFYHRLDVVDFWGALLAGVVIGLVNYLVSVIAEERRA